MLSQKQKSIKNTIVYLFFMLLTIIAAVISDNTHYLKLTAVFMIIAAYYIYRLIRKKILSLQDGAKIHYQLSHKAMFIRKIQQHINSLMLSRSFIKPRMLIPFIMPVIVEEKVFIYRLLSVIKFLIRSLMI